MKLPPGTLVEVEGQTTFGRFSPSVYGCQGGPVQLKVLGRAPLPEPLHLSLDQLADPRYQNQWIEVSGVVRHVISQLYPAPDFEEVIVTVGSASGRVKAVMFRSPASEELPTELIGAGVCVRGVFNAIFNDKGQFLGMWLANSSLDDFRVELPAPGKPFELPVRPIAALMHFDAQRSVSQRVRVQGIVTEAVAGRGMYIQDEDAGLWVNTVEPPAAQPGDRLDVVGFLAHGQWNSVLEDAVYQTRETGSLPEPLAITTEEALGGDYDGRRVVMERLLLQAALNPQQPTLVLRSADKVFQAKLANVSQREKGDRPHLPERPAANLRSVSGTAQMGAVPPEGSWLRLEGSCINTRGEDLLKESPPGLQERPRPASFHLLVGSAANVTVLRTPPWWTLQRVLVALGVILAAALAALAWVVVLRYRVTSQTHIIRQQMAREAVYEERARIARELHDTLEQTLGGISLHLHAVGKNPPHAPDAAQQVLDVARSLLEYSRSEARRSIADLRASLLENGDLAAALRTVVRQARSEADKGTTAVELLVEGQPRRLPGNCSPWGTQ